MKRALTTIVLSFLCLAFLPAAVYAQASITGVVKDTSGAVLPGVTVEAASPAIIEKVRTAVTDGSGQYRITELRPGAYTVTFTLTGFNTVKRDGINLTGAFTASVDAELRVGALEETITVTGEAPIVDVQSSTRQRVVDQEIISTLPTGRNMFNLGVLIPGISISTGGLASQDVGGALGPETRALVAHGGNTNDQRFMMNGVSLSSMIGGGWGGGAIPNATGVQEMVFDTASVSADLATGGVRINFIAREGGNQYHGSVFANFANDKFQTTNVDAALLARNPGLINAGTVDKNWDFNPGFGGPIKRDKLWFYASGRSQGAYLFAPGMFYNNNANDPTKWTYSPDINRPASLEKTWLDAQLRLSWQASQKNKIGFTYTQQDFCACHDAITATTAPEAAYDRRFPTQRVILMDWTSPVTNKILIEASGIHRVERWGNMHLQTKGLDLDPAMIAVTDQGANVPGLGVIANLNYRARGGANAYNNSWNNNFHYRFNVSYITGAHAFKVGMNNAHGYHENLSYQTNTLAYRFNNGVPNQLTMRALPHTVKNHVDQDLGIFAQDKWTINRLTVALGIRFDYHANSFPEQTLGPTRFTPNRNLTFPEQDNLSYKDITPKSQFVYDVFGNGKTALKLSINKYLTGLGTTNGVTPVTLGPNPINALNTSVSRSWTDNGNFVPDCDLLNPLAQNNLAAGGDSCGAFDDATFGRPTPNTVFDPDLLNGWGKRYYNWEFSTGVQHEILPRVSVDVGYFRRWYGNFVVQDNRAVAPSDFDSFSVTAPRDPRLPDGGGYVVSDLKNVSNAGFGRPADNFTTLADNYGKQIQHWNGVDVGVNARLSNGLFVQGGTSTGRTSTDNCEILTALPEVNPSGLPYCHEDSNWLTQFKGAASYTIPRIDVSTSATYQYLPGPEIAANWAVPSATIATSLGRPLSGGAATQTVNLVTPGTTYNDGLNQLDLRFAKIFRIGTTRTTINFDIYNATNSNTILTLNNGFVTTTTPATWQVPTAILQPRFWKIGAQFDF
jgi:Carboxypeptidase regulatory-like domain